MKKILLLSLVLMLLCWSFAATAVLKSTIHHKTTVGANLSTGNTAPQSVKATAIKPTSPASQNAQGINLTQGKRLTNLDLIRKTPQAGANENQIVVSPNAAARPPIEKVAVEPPPPNPSTILQGGDDFSRATVIPSLPYTDNGSTTGFAHNYTLSCLTSSTSPDVVYSYAPAADGAITASLQGSGFDTGIGIFKDNASTLIACNDDYYLAQSQVNNVPVLAGHTYYIVITGWSGANGPYVLNVHTANPPANDECTSPQVITGPYPQTVSGTTKEANFDCTAFPGVWYTIELPYEINDLSITFCPTPDSEVYAVLPYYFPDCSCTGETQMDLTWPTCQNGKTQPLLYKGGVAGPTTIYFLAYVSLDYPGNRPMDFSFTVNVASAVPCIVNCPPGAIAEGEPSCYDEYNDVTNGGCMDSPQSFGTVSDGETICGTSGTYLVGGNQSRDTDWYTLEVPSYATVTISGAGQFPFQMLLLQPYSIPCDTLFAFYGSGNVFPCSTLTMEATLGPGTYYIWAGPSNFTGVACGSPYYFSVNFSQPPQGPSNDLCENVSPVPLTIDQTVTFNGDNTGATNMGDCVYLNATPVVWHAFTVPQCMDVTIDYCGTSPAFGNAFLNLVTGCPCDGIIGADSYDLTSCQDGNITMHFLNLPPGTYYYPVMLDPATGAGPGPYTLHVNGTACIACEIQCPPNAIAEGEPVCADDYVDTYNGGCNSPQPVFGVVFPGQSICGTSGTYVTADTARKDTDWYTLTLSEISRVTVTGKAEFELLMYILAPEVAPCDTPYSIFTAGYAPACSTLSMDALLMPGTYYIWAGPYAYQGVPCGSQYYFTVTTSPQPADECNSNQLFYSNGGPDIAGSAYASQCDPFYPFIGGVADNFVIPGGGPVNVNTVIAYLTFGASTTPLDLDGVMVSIYANNAGSPGGQPIQDDPNCAHEELIPGGVIHSEMISPEAFTYNEYLPGIWQIVLPITPTALTAGTTYWLEIAPVLSLSLAGQSFVASTGTVTGPGATQVFPALQINTWTPIAPQADIAFCLLGVVGTIHGTAFNTDGVTPLPNVQVVTHTASEVVVNDQTANAQGVWDVDLPPGTYHEHITKVGFTPATINNIIVTEGAVTNVSINMITGTVCQYVVGDDNNSGTWTGQDVTYGVRFFKGGNPPPYRCECTPGHEWYVAGDVNGSCSFTGQDVTRMVLHFKSGVVGIPCPDCPPTSGLLLQPSQPAAGSSVEKTGSGQ